MSDGPPRFPEVIGEGRRGIPIAQQIAADAPLIFAVKVPRPAAVTAGRLYPVLHRLTFRFP